MAGDSLAHRAIKIRADAIGAALFDRMAGGAFGEDRLARSRIGVGQKCAEIRPRIRARIAFLALHEIARFRALWQFAAVRMEIHARCDRAAERDDTGEKDPAGGGVETVVHCVLACEKSVGSMVARRSSEASGRAQVRFVQ